MVKEAAEQLGVARPSLSRVLNGQAAISPEMKWLCGLSNG
jgi:plasmid maintenance system antidote protein VapI